MARRIFSCGLGTLRCGMWDLVPWPGIEPWAPCIGSLSHWTTREVTILGIFIIFNLNCSVSYKVVLYYSLNLNFLNNVEPLFYLLVIGHLYIFFYEGSMLISVLKNWISCLFTVVVVQSLSRVWLFATPWTALRQASLSFTVSGSLLTLMSTESFYYWIVRVCFGYKSYVRYMY